MRKTIMGFKTSVLSKQQMRSITGAVSEQYWGYILDETDLPGGCPSGFYCGDAHGWICNTSSGGTTLVNSEQAAVSFIQAHPSVGVWCTPR